MTRRAPARTALSLSTLSLSTLCCLALVACGPETPEPQDGGPDPVDAGPVDAGRADAGPDAGPDGGPQTDGGPGTDVGDVTVCPNEPVQTGDEACVFTAGTGGGLLLQGDVLGPQREMRNGQVLVDAKGVIQCVACNCAGTPGYDTAARIACSEGVVSPGLVNAHDHITFTGNSPVGHGTERYNHRHDWRKGLNRGGVQYTKLSVPQTNSATAWGELRMVMGGATSLFGSGGAPGLVRNLDLSGAQQEGLNKNPAKYETFPLDDNDGQLLASGCGYPSLPRPTDTAIARADAYVPHVAEGIDREAHNEFNCLSSSSGGGQDIVMPKTSIIHGIGLTANDFGAMAADHAGLIWSPRSNIDLYGFTAEVTLADRMGVRIALGTDWTASGSMNVLRELKCADSYNRNNLGGYFTDRQLHAMATKNAAALLAFDAHLGSLEPGKVADISIFARNGRASGYRSVLDAGAPDVLLVLRGGKVLFGESSLVAGLGEAGCEPIDVCGQGRKVCAQRETGSSVAALKSAAGGNPYALFFCDTPVKEPSCVPARHDEFSGQSAPDDRDGDGLADGSDNCPDTFNPPRRMDAGVQPDADGDGKGDVCDPCPLDKDTTTCNPPSPDDRDGDGLEDSEDNCPMQSNADQADADTDGKGDLCDACPQSSNPGTDPCAFDIYQVRQNAQSLASVQVVIAEALVTAVGSDGYHLQHVEGDTAWNPTLGPDWSALFAYTGATGAKPAVGDRVEVRGTVGDYYGRTELMTPTHRVVSSGHALPAPVLVPAAQVATGGARAQKLESAFVRVEGVAVTNLAPTPGPGDKLPTNEIEVTGGLRVNDYFHLMDPPPAAGEQFAYVQGMLRWANGNSKVEPRSAADLGRRAFLVGLAPARVFVATGTSGPTLPELRAELGAPAVTAVDLALSSSDARVTVPATMTIPAGQSSAPVPLTAGAAGPDPVVVTAIMDGMTESAQVVVYDPAGARTIAALEAGAPTAIGGTIRLVVRLDAPAGPGGATVALSMSPEGILGLPASALLVPEGALEAGTDGTAITEGTTTVTATLGGSTATVDVQVLAAPTERAPVPGDLRITEVMANPGLTGTDTVAEWFEIGNVSTSKLNIEGISVEDNAGKAVSVGTRLVLDPGQHIVFAFTADPTVNKLPAVHFVYGNGAPTTSPIQLGNNSDRVVIEVPIEGGGRVESDRYEWTSTTAGVSACLKAPYGTAWGKSSATWATGSDKGSPGEASTAGNCQ